MPRIPAARVHAARILPLTLRLQPKPRRHVNRYLPICVLKNKRNNSGRQPQQQSSTESKHHIIAQAGALQRK